MSRTEQKIVIMNFSGIYEHENFCKDNVEKKSIFTWVDLRHMSGCNCYCDDEARDAIQAQIKDFSVNGIHFIDSGNYHYMSRIWLEKINQPFRLLVFDNHTDMQPPAFGGILSCGGWIAAAVEELPNLMEVLLVGPVEEAYEQVEEHIQKKTRFLSREILQDKESEEVYEQFSNISHNDRGETIREKADACNFIKRFFKEIPTDLPLYISIDKDVLCQEDASTTWSQGEMKLSELCFWVKYVLRRFRDAGQDVLGVDICGESDVDQILNNEKNDIANEKLLKLFSEEIYR